MKDAHQFSAAKSIRVKDAPVDGEETVHPLLIDVK